MDAPPPERATGTTIAPARAARARKPLLPRDTLQQAVGERYRLEAALGQGGFGVVWKARDELEQRTCCIKFLWPELARGFPLVRFKREFRTARRVQHPACVRVFDLGEGAPIWFFTMECVDGGHLGYATAVRGDARAVVSIALQVLAALDEIHSRAIIHRDVKPQNILLDLSGAAPVAKLTDFGVARVGDLDDDDRVHALRGSLHYMAPETVVDGIADARCDLYALGVTLYTVLAGVHPLGPARTANERLEHIGTRSARPLAETAPHVPAPVAQVVMRLCARDPHDRYRSAAQAYDHLAAWLGSVDGTVPELPPLHRGPYLAAPRLVGRDDARRDIQDFLAANLTADAPVDSATAPLLIVSGPAGVGKSRLLSWLIRAAEAHKAQALIGQCRSEIGGPFEAVEPILAQLRQWTKGHAAPADVDETQSGDDLPLTSFTLQHASAELAKNAAAPDGSTPSDKSQPSDDSSASSTRPDGTTLRQLLHQLTEQLLAAIDRCPALIVLEDAQWSDAETLDLLTMWARSIAAHRAEGRHLYAALVITHRPRAADSDLVELSDNLVAEGRARAIRLAELNQDMTAALVAELLMTTLDDTLRQACARLFRDRSVTPLYISQVLRLLMARGYLTTPGQPWAGQWDFSRLDEQVQRLIPTTLTGAIGERAARFSIDTKSLLSVAAVLGRRFALLTASKAADLDPDLARECLEEAERGGFVSADATGDEAFVFTHDRFRETLYQALADDVRRGLHGTAARVLLAQSRRKGRDVATDLAHHYHFAELHQPAVRFCSLAGDQAMKRNQFSQASELYSRAVDHADATGSVVKLRVLERLGDAASLALHVDRADAAYRRILGRVQHLTHRIRIHTRLAELYDRAQDWNSAEKHYSQAVVLGLPWYLRATAPRWGCIVTCFFVQILGTPALTTRWHRLITGRLSPRRRQLIQRAALQVAMRSFGHGRRATAHQYAILSVAAGFQEPDSGHGAPYGIAATFVSGLMAIAGADHRSRQWAALCDPLNPAAWSPRDQYFFYAQRGAAALSRAEPELALRDLERAFALASERRDPLDMQTISSTLLGAYLYFLNHDRALTLLAKLRRFAREEGLERLEPWLLVWTAYTYCCEGQIDLAARTLKRLRECPHRLDPDDAVTAQIWLLIDLRLRLSSGYSEELARQVLDAFEESARRPAHSELSDITSALFFTAMSVCIHVEPLPPGLRTRLARVRRRPRPLTLKSRWLAPTWLMSYALYDAMAGKHAGASRHLDAALGFLRRHRVPQTFIDLCAAGERGFRNRPDLARRCTQALDELAGEQPACSPSIVHTREFYAAMATSRASRHPLA
jgi:tetratricopeptide (TPR) repeat protein/tRNA A-37 threonylcarbamoyl transferase component Bud32